MTPNEKVHWIRLVRTKGLGIGTLHLLMKLRKDAKSIIRLIEEIKSTTPLKKIRSIYGINAAELEIERTEEKKGEIITVNESIFPEKLMKMPQFPPVITVSGNIELLRRDIITIVGSRNASINTRNMVHDFAKSLSESFVVSSGLALGVDTAVNKVIFSGYPTIAVLANGIDIYYPEANKEMQDKIANDGGLLVSEQALSSHPAPFKFIRRNAIMVALSSGITIAEAAKNSGSMNTAAHAIKQEKPLFVMPGYPQSKNSEGSNDLLRKGAIFVEFPEDIIKGIKESGKPSYPTQCEFFASQKNNFENFSGMQPDHKEVQERILSNLDFMSLPIEALIAELQEYPTHLILSTLVTLELNDLITISDSNTVCRKIKK